MHRRVIIFTYGYRPFTSSGGPGLSVEAMLEIIPNKSLVVTYKVDSNKIEDKENKILLSSNNKIKYCYTYPGLKTLIEFIRIILNINDNDIIYFNSLFRFSHTFIPLSIIFFTNLFVKKIRSKIIIAPRNELEEGQLRFKLKKKKIYLFILNLMWRNKLFFQATNKSEVEDILAHIKVKNENIFLCPNISILPLTKNKLMVNKKETNSLNLLYFGRIAPDKNVHLIPEIIHGTYNYKNLTIDFWGPIRDESYWKEIIIDANRRKINYCYKGIFKSYDPQYKQSILQNYHALLFPTVSENHGHVIAESLSSGVPVITSDKTPWKCQGEFKETGLAIVKNQNIKGYRENVNYLIKSNQFEFDELREKALKTYSILNENNIAKIESVKMFNS